MRGRSCEKQFGRGWLDLRPRKSALALDSRMRNAHNLSGSGFTSFDVLICEWVPQISLAGRTAIILAREHSLENQVSASGTITSSVADNSRCVGVVLLEGFHVFFVGENNSFSSSRRCQSVACKCTSRKIICNGADAVLVSAARSRILETLAPKCRKRLR